ncbi:biopolymer transporter ExbD [Flavobacterium album]|uniref:Biopolymer transporter ExbD n=1 Tax=Flavobacterium album TaxID=2175091 RepID=A0A2S1QYF8_9FLAO|nr:biopolymer transporter ExbD [Flavobacterium album]AWH85369.1 biopolymer transporter ExbD [Flavobacterium album]
MRVRRNKRFHAEIAASALSDIMFFLLLFFLIISTLANPNVIKLMLPKARTTATTDKAHTSVSVLVMEDETKQYFIDKVPVTYEELESKLAEQVQKTGDNTVIVRFPYNCLAQDMVDLLQVGERLKLKFVIAVSKQ